MEEEKDSIEDRIVILTKETLDRLLKEKNPADLISLYTFFYYTSKWQKTREVKATQNYVKKGLGWGIDKVAKNEKKLEELGLIKKFEKKNELGQITGWYVKVNYVFSGRRAEKIIKNVQNTQKPQVEETISGEQETNALITNTINTIITNKEYTTEEVLDTKVTFPINRGKSPKERLLYLHGKLYKKNRGIDYKPNHGKDYKMINSMLELYSEIQVGYLLCLFHNWYGISGNDSKAFNSMCEKNFPLTFFVYMKNDLEVYARNVISAPFDDDSKLLDEVIKIVSQ